MTLTLGKPSTTGMDPYPNDQPNLVPHWADILSTHQAATCVVILLGAGRGAQCHQHLGAKTMRGGSPLRGQHQTRCEEQKERDTLH